MANQPRVIAPESRSVENTSAAAIVAHTVVKADSTGTDGLVEVEICGAGELAYGVADNEIAVGAIGRVQTRGVAKVLCAGTLTVGGECATDAAGKAVDATTGDRVLGTSLTAGGAGVIAEVELAGPGADTHA